MLYVNHIHSSISTEYARSALFYLHEESVVQWLLPRPIIREKLKAVGSNPVRVEKIESLTGDSGPIYLGRGWNGDHRYHFFTAQFLGYAELCPPQGPKKSYREIHSKVHGKAQNGPKIAFHTSRPWPRVLLTLLAEWQCTSTPNPGSPGSNPALAASFALHLARGVLKLKAPAESWEPVWGHGPGGKEVGCKTGQVWRPWVQTPSGSKKSKV